MAEERTADKAIGVFDSGIGGLTVVRELMRNLPNENIVYLGDTARLPYGTKSPEVVRRFARENLAFLKGKDVKLIIIACNTASSVALPQLAKDEKLPVVGVIEPGAKAAVKVSGSRRIAVIGTTATIRSGSYERALKAIEPDVEIWPRACPLFVPLVEEGWLDCDVTRLTAERYLSGIEDFGADVLVLGCTHYPLLKGVIQNVVGEGVTLVDSAYETALEVARVLKERGLERSVDAKGKIDVYVTDIPYSFKDVGERFLGSKIDGFSKVDLTEIEV